MLRERESAEFGREIERKEHEIRTERARKKRGREARQLPGVSMWPQQPFHAHANSGELSYQILPCSHRVHRECAIAMIQNGV